MALGLCGVCILATAPWLAYQLCFTDDGWKNDDKATALAPRLYYQLLVPCTLPLGLAAVVWNWMSLKLFKHTISPPLSSLPAH